MNEKTELQVEINKIVTIARDFIVDSIESVHIASSYLKECKERLIKINETFDPIVEKAHAAHKEALAQKKKHSDPVAQAKKIIGSKVAAFESEQQRIRLEKERIAREEARKVQEEQRLAEALLLQDAGMTEEAESVLTTERPLEIQKTEEAPKIEGLSFRENWCFEVVDVNQIPREFLIVNEKAIGAVVRSKKEKKMTTQMQVQKKNLSDVGTIKKLLEGKEREIADSLPSHIPAKKLIR